MIAATSIALGFVAVQLRSVVAYAIISTIILMTFLAAVIFSGGNAQWLLLGQSVLFFNLGMVLDVVLLTFVETLRRRRQVRG